MIKVAILGSGLSSAFANRACLDHGIVPDVFSLSGKYEIPKGAVWFHWLPYNAEPLSIISMAMGKKELYLKKQWGEYNPAWKTSFPTLRKVEEGFSIPLHIGFLWRGTPVNKVEGGFTDQEIIDLSWEYDLVVQTFPSSASREVMGKFVVKIPVWVSNGNRLDPRKIFLHEQLLAEHDIVVFYNGFEEKWVRRTLIANTVYTEYSQDFRESIEGKVYHYPDLHPDCPKFIAPLANNILMTGRYATWDRKELSHQTYGKVYSMLNKLTMS